MYSYPAHLYVPHAPNGMPVILGNLQSVSADPKSYGTAAPGPAAPAPAPGNAQPPEAPEGKRSRAARRRRRGGRSHRNRQDCDFGAAQGGEDTSGTTPTSSPSAAELLDLLAGPSPQGQSRPPADAKAPGSPLPGGNSSFFGTTPPPPMTMPSSAELALWQALGDTTKEKDMSQEQMNYALERLDSADREQRQLTVRWTLKAPTLLAQHRNGTRIVQKAIEVASQSDRDALVSKLGEYVTVRELYQCPNGNHVLAKIIEVVPSTSPSIGSVIAAFRAIGTGVVCKHRFGCRLMERLIEHCDDNRETQPEFVGLVDEIENESGLLCKHGFGNFVVQHLLEHGSQERRRAILNKMMDETEVTPPQPGQPDIKGLPQLAGHRTASHTVQRLLEYSDEAGKLTIVQTLLDAETPHSIAEVACGRYGSFVIEQIKGYEEKEKKDGGAPQDPLAAAVGEIRARLSENSSKLAADDFGIKVLRKYGLTSQEGGGKAAWSEPTGAVAA